MVETRRDSRDVFAAILEAMAAMRETETLANPSSPGPVAQSAGQPDPIEPLREAYMRQTIRAAAKEGFQRIAVVCGAWHAPVLARMGPAKDDAALLKGLPKAKVAATWVPWTYGRLTRASGYGAGVQSPGWYHHLWDSLCGGVSSPTDSTIRWLARTAGLLRDEDLDVSSAHVIEAVRLAEGLAAIRRRPLPGLEELTEATQAVFCQGGGTQLRLIHEKLIVGEALGQVPDETPMVPLAADLGRLQKRLRLPAAALEKVYDLDLRNANDLERSHILHRLTLLGVAWGERQDVGRKGAKSGTFHEVWKLRWDPELAVAVIEAAIWGNTVAEAAAAFARDLADKAADLPALTALLDAVMLADLPEAAAHVMQRVQNEAAVASDVAHLMEALPPLANIVRYGNVRQTDAGMVSQVVDGLVARMCVGLPAACGSLSDEAAGAMFEHLLRAHGAITLLARDEHLDAWHAVLRSLADQANLHGLLAGRCCRLLLDDRQIEPAEAARRMGLALSVANEPAQAGSWVEGFLRGSGLLLLHDETLWQVLDDWVTGLHGDTFTQLLPLLRRTFATFAPPERRQMGERVKGSSGGSARAAVADETEANFDLARADAVLPLVAKLLGLEATP